MVQHPAHERTDRAVSLGGDSRAKRSSQVWAVSGNPCSIRTNGPLLVLEEGEFQSVRVDVLDRISHGSGTLRQSARLRANMVTAATAASGRPGAPNATAAAVEVRSTVGPSCTGVAPAADSAAISSSAIPPSGPTISSSESACATGSSVRLTVADSCNTSVVALSSRARCTNSAVDTSPVTDGMYGRRDWRAADLGHRTPSAQTLVGLCPVPSSHTARGLPRHERVGARLGGQLDRQLRAIGLGQGLH